MGTVDFSKPSITESEIRSVVSVLKSKWLTTGKITRAFESEIARICQGKYAVAVNSCTAALHLALLCAGISKGDEVITTPFTFVATINAILYLGAKPVLVDIKPDDFIIDETLIESKITKKTKAIIAVHYAGNVANLDALNSLCRKHNLVLIEDSAHAFGSEYKTHPIGSQSMLCCFSFYPTKNITTVEGGALVTNSKKIYSQAKTLALHGISKDAWKRYTKSGTWKYDVTELGFKYNLSDLGSALGLAQLRRLKEMKMKRNALYKFYAKELAGLNELNVLRGNTHGEPFRHLFVVQIISKTKTRDMVLDRLKKRDIICSVHFIPVYRFSFFKREFKWKTKDFPNCERAYKTALSLPFGADMSIREAKKVVTALKDYLS